MAVYGEFDRPKKMENITIGGETKNPLLFGQFTKDLEQRSEKGKLIKKITLKDIIPNTIKFMFYNYFPKSANAIILDNYVYLLDFSVAKMDQITDQMIRSYESNPQASPLVQKEKEFLIQIIQSRFVQFLKENKDVLTNPRDTIDFIVNFLEQDDLIKTSGTGGFWTEFHESLNFLYFYYKFKSYDISFFHYLLCLAVPEYGKTKIDAEDYKIIKLYGSNISIALHENAKILFAFISLEYNNNKQDKWYTSTLLTFQQIKNSGVFDENKKYRFYSENSLIYKNIFDKISSIIKTKGKIFDAYFRALDANKYFISDFLVIEDGPNGSRCIREILDYIKVFSRETNTQTLSNLFEFMDKCFLDKHFVPVSLKQIKKTGRVQITEKLITEMKPANNLVVIINRPEKIQNSNFSNLNIDDFDRYLINLLGKENLNEEINNTFKLIKNSFQYPLSQSINLKFKFEIHLKNIDNKVEKKKYLFVVTPTSIKIAKEKTASATGEGTINKYSLNYILKEIYKGKFKNQLLKLSKNRDFASLLNNQDNKKDKVIKKYISLMARNEILAFDKSKTSNDKSAFDILKECLIEKSNSQCITHFLGYYNKLMKSNEKFIGNSKDLEKKLTLITSREIGIVLDANIKIDNSLKLSIEDFDRKKIILSEWGLITARGPIEFEGTKFKDAKELKEATKYQIKFPALVKIGI